MADSFRQLDRGEFDIELHEKNKGHHRWLDIGLGHGTTVSVCCLLC